MSPGQTFAVLGPRRRVKLRSGDVFAWRLDGSDLVRVGQVVDDAVGFAGARLALVVFFDTTRDEYERDHHLDHSRIIGRPFVTNNTGWNGGHFIALSPTPAVGFGRVVLKKVSGQILDTTGEEVSPDRADVVIPFRLSPPGAIARWLATWSQD